MPQTARRGQVRRAPMPRHPRRVSGPVARAVPAAPSIAVPRRRGQTGVFERLRALPEHRLVDRLLRSRAWIWLIAIMLGGIVTMQVSLLKLNAGISKNVETASTLERVNADLETEVAKLSSGERIQQTAAEEGMVTPSAGDVGFLRARPDSDPRLAAQRMQKPSSEAQEVMANGGHAVGVAPVTAATTTTDPTSTATTTAAAAATTTTTTPAATPVATAVPPAPTATPEPTVDPAATNPAG
jgi:cell division protein FtsL